MRNWLPLLLLLCLASCATYFAGRLDDRYGKADPARYDKPTTTAANYSEVKTILDNRCAVCHGCNDAPCQLNLASHQGLTRGANPESVYVNRLIPAAPT